MQIFFDLKVTPYILVNNNLLKLHNTNTSPYSMQALSFKGSIIWNTVPTNRYKNLISFDEFKQ